ncbi:unnamed protein product, partial [Heterosigma akashiwo]
PGQVRGGHGRGAPGPRGHGAHGLPALRAARPGHSPVAPVGHDDPAAVRQPGLPAPDGLRG